MVAIESATASWRVASAASDSAIEVHGVGHRYSGQSGETEALGAIDLAIGRSAFVAILGPSGCGKTTLLRALSGLLVPSHGTVELDGESPTLARRRRAIGWLAQEDGLLPWLRVRDNVSLALRLRDGRRFWPAGRASRAHAKVADEMLARVGLEGVGRQYPHELSGGMRQRAALARALVARPPFLLLDEPFAHLDELTRERLGQLLLDLRVEHAPTTVLVTHSTLEAVRLADRVVVLTGRPGQIALDVRVDLEPPRREDQPGFGVLVRQLKSALGLPIL